MKGARVRKQAPKAPPDRVVVSWCPEHGPQLAELPSRKGVIRGPCSRCRQGPDLLVVSYKLDTTRGFQ